MIRGPNVGLQNWKKYSGHPWNDSRQSMPPDLGSTDTGYPSSHIASVDIRANESFDFGDSFVEDETGKNAGIDSSRVGNVRESDRSFSHTKIVSRDGPAVKGRRQY